MVNSTLRVILSGRLASVATDLTTRRARKGRD
jgi:hypothetical protein